MIWSENLVVTLVLSSLCRVEPGRAPLSDGVPVIVLVLGWQVRCHQEAD